MNPFAAVLTELGQALELELSPDENDSCFISFPDEMSVQLEVEPEGRFLLIGSELGQVPTGRYREDLFEAALRSNGGPHPRHGTLAFSPKTEQLVLCAELPMNGLNGGDVAAFLESFMKKAERWREALASNIIPAPDDLQLPPGARATGGAPFGMRS